ncbi:TRAP transporter small permease [Desulfovibrio ferrophilus]|uniref:TRAP transporter, DctQ-like membrane protein n=1 Tax=Desulfovibrio ferrophilus TaxID=241368 RepID=A0A2Z6B131_9BACT|nr:TRAP transporter small permease [Desulfovibrio ferrophilus]BBD09163.1 TRAP transporter, DctQ-like membrane protein [Desulfovibrio ferrophilus]
MQLLRAVNTFFNKYLSMLIAVAFSMMTLLIFAQVVCRYVFQDPLSWSEELARYIFIWLTFCGASVAFYENTHIKVSYFIERIGNPRLQAGMFLIADALCLWFLWVFVTDGVVVASRVLSLGQVSSSMGFIPVGIVYLAVPIGSLFMALNVLYHALMHVQTILGKS